VAEPDLLPVAMEELLRAYAPVTMARLVKEDMDFNGCPMKANDFVLVPFPAANRDPVAFDRPDEVIIDREVNRHAAFGLGIHRCTGSHLARMELRVVPTRKGYGRRSAFDRRHSPTVSSIRMASIRFASSRLRVEYES
jgi:cytochrome P450